MNAMDSVLSHFRYVFCLVPINRRHQKVAMMFLKFARKFSRNEPLTFDWLAGQVDWPLPTPETITDLSDLEGIFDVTDMYLWLGLRFVDMFPDMHLVRDMQGKLELLVQQGVTNIVKLLKNLEKEQQEQPVFVSRRHEKGTTTASPARASNLVEENMLRQKQARLQKISEEADTKKKLKQILSEHSSAFSSSKRRGAKSSVTEELISKGLLNREMLEELKKEWLGNSHDKSPRRKTKKRK